MTQSRQSRRKHTRERRRRPQNPQKPARIRKIPQDGTRARVHPGWILELIPLAGAILCILAIGLLALRQPPSPAREDAEKSAFAQLQRKIARQALAVHYAAERFRRKMSSPYFE